MNLRITDCRQLGAHALRLANRHHLTGGRYSIFSIQVSSPSHGEIVIDIPLDRDEVGILQGFRDAVDSALSETFDAITAEADSRFANSGAAGLNTRDSGELLAEAADTLDEMNLSNNAEDD